MSNYKNKDSKKLPQRFLQNAILKLLRKKPGKVFSTGNITSKLKTKNSKDSVKSALITLEKAKKVISSKDGKYAIHPNYASSDRSSKGTVLQGRADLTSSGGAYIIVDGQERDIYVPPKFVNGALAGDTVEIVANVQKGRRPEGKITKILKRKRVNFIGTFQSFNKYGYVNVEAQRMSLEIKIMPNHFGEANDDDAVVVEIIEFGTGSKKEIIGKVLEVLNTDDRNDFEMNSILINNGFEIIFPPEVLEESEALSDDYPEEEIAKRKDLRDTLTFTIDPHNAKDFDDAISYEKLENGDVNIGVHIADVTHFVRPGSALDKDAYSRSTSVYLVDRVCPMLPERISNELCSLRPNEDKLSFSVIFTFGENHQLKDTWMGKTIIHSDRRFTYEEAQEVLDGERKELVDELIHINTIAKSLNKQRFKEGSINFESDEVKFELDEDGTPIGIYKKTRKDANKLIEEYMLLANKSVARYMTKKDDKEVPYIYRIHDTPDPDRLMELAILASEFGIKLNFDTPKHITEALNSLSEPGEQEDILNVLKPMAIRCMSKAAYSSNNIGHYGLGFEFYSHFTSPIRRYSDVLAHRVLHENLTNIKRSDKTTLEDKCLYISLKERDAITAERESIKYKQVEYYSSRIGTITTGIIRNIIDRGMFIEIAESQADGFIPLDSLEEPVTMHPAKIKITGNKTAKVWRIGDEVQIEILNVDMDKRQIDLRLNTDEMVADTL